MPLEDVSNSLNIPRDLNVKQPPATSDFQTSQLRSNASTLDLSNTNLFDDSFIRSKTFTGRVERLRNSWTHSLREVKSDKTHYCIGCTSIFLVVFTVAICVSAIAVAPVIFLGQAENSGGEVDVRLSANSASSFSRLNYTAIVKTLAVDENLANKDEKNLFLSSPRYENIDVDIVIPTSCSFFDVNDPNNITSSYLGPTILADDISSTKFAKQQLRNRCQELGPRVCLFYQCSTTLTIQAFYIDSLKEKTIDVGRTWDFRPLNANQCYINHLLAEALDIKVGETIYISTTLRTFANIWKTSVFLHGGSASSIQALVAAHETNIPLRVEGIFNSDKMNKFTKSGDDNPYQVVLEYSKVLPSIASHLNPLYPSALAEYWERNPGLLYEEAKSVIFSCGRSRFKCYLSTDFQKTATSLLSWASGIVFRLSYKTVSATLPVLEKLENSSLILQFLGLIFSLVILLLSALAIFLIYSLLMVSVETKTWELGVLRMIGVTRSGIIELLIIQSLAYAIPAWMFGLSMAQILFLYVRMFFQKSSNISVDPLLTSSSVTYASILGLLVPILASIGPIRQALSGNLRDSLDRRRAKVKAVIITIERNQASWRSMSGLLIVGGLLTIFGFLIYYLLPLSLVSNNFALLFNIFFGLLLGMLFGLILFSINLQPLLERLCLNAFMILAFAEKPFVKALVKKNLISHKLRNRKTSTMFAFALSFIIFLNVNLSVELRGLEWRYASFQIRTWLP